MRSFLYKWNRGVYFAGVVLFIVGGCLLVQCHSQRIPLVQKTVENQSKTTKSNPIDRGKKVDTYQQSDLYYEEVPDSLIFKNQAQDVRIAATNQLTYLKWKTDKNNQYLGPVTVTYQDLQKTALFFAKLDSLSPSTLLKNFRFQRLSGGDSLGNVLYTGYFTPTLQVRKQRDSVFRFPFYKHPLSRKGQKLPTRDEIDYRNALQGKQLEIAWSDNLFDNFILHVQGSGIVEFEDGSKRILAYDGKNGHPYTSIGKELIKMGEIDENEISLSSIKNWVSNHPEQERQILSTNESYIFFKLDEPVPKGAASVPLTTSHSVAVDTDYIPMGGILLAEVPVLNQLGRLSHHEYRILFAQDRGGAIKGPGRLDLYSGVGEAGKALANSLNHYGRVWLLLPK